MIKALPFLAAALLALSSTTAGAATIGLFDWALNVNGTISTPPVAHAGLDASLFDDVTGLGSLTLDFSPGAAGNYFVGAFFDHEIDEAINTFFNEYGGVSGAPTAGQSWEIDEPGWDFGDIFDNVEAGTLDNSNAVPPSAPDDVSLALGWNFNLLADERALITFTLTESAPASGFYLYQLDPDSDAGIYLTSSNVIRGGQSVPEPSTLLLLGFGLAGALFGRRKLQKMS